jgi:hypothetical protein
VLGDVEATTGRLLRVLLVLGSGLPTEAEGLAQALRAFPLADLSVCHVVKDSVLVTKPEEPSGKPPLDRSADHGAAAPAIGFTATFVVAGVVDPLE